MHANQEFEESVKGYHQAETLKHEKIQCHKREIQKASQAVENAYEKMVSLCPKHEYKGFMVKACTVCGHVTSFIDKLSFVNVFKYKPR